MAFNLGRGVIEVGLAGMTKLGSALNGLKGMVSRAVGGVASTVGSILGMAGIGSVGAFIGLAISEAADGQAALAKFNQALEATGGISGITGDELETIAGDLARLAGFAPPVTMGIAAMMTQFTNVRGDQFKALIPLAADVSARLGTDMASSAEQLAKALNNPIQGMRQLKILGVVFNKEQEKTIQGMLASGNVIGVQNMMLDALNSRFAGAAETMGKTFGGQLRRLWESINSVAEVVGNILLPYLQSLIEWITVSMVPSIGGWIESLIDVGKSVAEFLTPTFEWFKNVAVWVFDVLVFYVKHWRDVVDKVVLEVIVAYSQLYDYLAFVFTSAIPKVGVWFANNWVNLFMDAVTAIGTIFDNLYENIKNFWSNVWNYITSWGQSDWTFAWTPLLDGFKATTEKFPDVMAGFDFSDATKSYMDQLTKTSERLTLDVPVRTAADKMAQTAGEAAKKVAAMPYNVQTSRAAQLEGGGVVGLADLAKNLQTQAFKTKDIDQEQLDEMGAQTGLLGQIADQGARTNNLLSDLGVGAVLG